MLEQKDVKLITFDQCMLGLVSKETKTPMQKRTCILTNVPEIVSAMDGKFCDGSHPHQKIEGSEGDARGLSGLSTTPIKWWTPCAKQFWTAKSAVLIDQHHADGPSRKK